MPSHHQPHHHPHPLGGFFILHRGGGAIQSRRCALLAVMVIFRGHNPWGVLVGRSFRVELIIITSSVPHTVTTHVTDYKKWPHTDSDDQAKRNERWNTPLSATTESVSKGRPGRPVWWVGLLCMTKICISPVWEQYRWLNMCSGASFKFNYAPLARPTTIILF